MNALAHLFAYTAMAVAAAIIPEAVLDWPYFVATILVGRSI